MYSFKKSLAAIAGLLVLVAAFAALTPLVGQGQGGRDNAPLQRGPRQFYLTQTSHDGSEALTACAEGYHMASLWEIFDPSNFKYNTELGLTTDDSGSGPPTSGGWIRTGAAAAGSGKFNPGGTGSYNCEAWTSASPTVFGSAVALHSSWNDAPTSISPWAGSPSDCNNELPVWCVQD